MDIPLSCRDALEKAFCRKSTGTRYFGSGGAGVSPMGRKNFSGVWQWNGSKVWSSILQERFPEYLRSNPRYVYGRQG